MKFKNTTKGASTVELLIAFAILILNITAVILLISGGQSIYVDAETNNEALGIARTRVAEAKSTALSDFNSITGENDSVTLGPLTYDVESIVDDLSPCFKKFTSSIDYEAESRPQNVIISTLIGSAEILLALGGDCDTGPSDNFDNPGSLVSEELGGQGATAIDSFNNKLYLTSNKFPPSSNSDFYVFNFDPISSTLNLASELDLGEGLNDVDIVDTYAYVASDSNTGQLQVIDLSTMTRVDSATRQLPGTTVAEGNKLFFFNDKIYIGTLILPCPPSCLPSQNNEFHIYDLSNPTNPTWEDSLNLDHNINDIYIVGDFAYLATSDNTRELMVININPSSPNYLEHPDISGFGYNAPGNNDGTSVYVLGNKVYLGRKQNTPTASHDFFVLNVNDVTDNGSQTDGLLDSIDLNIQNNGLVTGIIVKGNLAFISQDDATIGIKIIDLMTMTPPSTCASFNFSENNTGIDMEGNFIFVSSRSNKEVRVIYDQPLACS